MNQGTLARPGDLVTVVVAPREKVSILSDCLQSLFSTIPPEVHVLVCMPKLPDAVRRASKKLMDARGHAELIELEGGVIPHKARSVGVERVRTPWVVFTDNDIAFAENWFSPMVAAMRDDSADVLAPLIFIGPPVEKNIHHAGGMLNVTEDEHGGITVTETHRHMGEAIDSPGIEEALVSNEYRSCDVAEFHCLAARTELLQGDLSLPTQLITREQQDLALKCRKHGLRVRFVPESRVTYLARSEFNRDDLRYHAARWGEQRAHHSLDYMESEWGYQFERSRVVYDWIEMHRRRPFRERHRLIARLPDRLQIPLFKVLYGCEV